MKRVVVIGLGNFGSAVAEELYAKGHEVIAVDTDPEAVSRISGAVTRAVIGDGRDPALLAQVGASGAEVGVIGTGDDITASVLAVLALKDLGVAEIHVKVISHAHARVAEKLGITATVFPERESGVRLARGLSSTAVLNHIPLGPGCSLQEVAVPDRWVGRTLRDLDLRRSHGVAVVAVRDVLRERINGIPNPDAVLTESDTLFLMGPEDALGELAAGGRV